MQYASAGLLDLRYLQLYHFPQRRRRRSIVPFSLNGLMVLGLLVLGIAAIGLLIALGHGDGGAALLDFKLRLSAALSAPSLPAAYLLTSPAALIALAGMARNRAQGIWEGIWLNGSGYVYSKELTQFKCNNGWK